MLSQYWPKIICQYIGMSSISEHFLMFQKWSTLGQFWTNVADMVKMIILCSQHRYNIGQQCWHGICEILAIFHQYCGNIAPSLSIRVGQVDLQLDFQARPLFYPELDLYSLCYFFQNGLDRLLTDFESEVKQPNLL